MCFFLILFKLISSYFDIMLCVCVYIYIYVCNRFVSHGAENSNSDQFHQSIKLTVKKIRCPSSSNNFIRNINTSSFPFHHSIYIYMYIICICKYVQQNYYSVFKHHYQKTHTLNNPSYAAFGTRPTLFIY